ncbi:MAG: trigger factor [Francisellaceae bacterium]
MQVSVEKKEGIHCTLAIELPAETIDQEVKKRINKIAKTAKLDGFRPGKVPVGVIKKRYGEQVRFEVLGEVLPQNYTKAIADENLNAAGVEIELTHNKEGEPVKFNANLELFPEFEVTGLDTIEVEKPVVEITEVETDKMIINLRQQLATWHEVDRVASKEDKVTVDFVGRVDGEVFEGGSADASEITIGSDQMIPGFEDGIIGMVKDEEKTIKVSFPEDYHNKELAGKPAEFDIVVKAIKAPELPEINDEFAKKFGVDSAEDFHTEIKNNMKRELKAAIQRKTKEQVFAGLAKVVEFDIPKALLKKEINRMKQDLIQRMGGDKAAFNAENLPDELFQQKAETNVKLGLILSHIVDAQKIEADDESIDNMIEEMTQVYEDADEVRKHFKTDKKELENIKAVVIENKLIDWVLQQAKVSDKTVDFFELIRETMPQNAMM